MSFRSSWIFSFIGSAAFLFSTPIVIDFSKVPFEDPFHGEERFIHWFNAFNRAPELASFFAKLKEDYQIKVAVETGTFQASTTKFLSLLFDQVHTVEFSDSIFQAARFSLRGFRNVQCHLGSSEKVLERLLPSLSNQTLFFYLDAHWYDSWPLLEELEMIALTHKDRCIIAIDDFKVPGRDDIGYDSYKGDECSFEYIREKLDKIFSDYDAYYLIPHNVSARAKFVALPKSWRFQYPIR